MTQEFNPRKSYLALKANENMIAFVGFVFDLEKRGETKEGVVKLSSFHRPYGGGYLTLTFIVDKGQDKALVRQLERLCDNLTENAIRPLLGKEFERLVKVDLDSLEETKGWYLEEINVHFSVMEGREKVLIEERLFPALERILPCKFDPVDWWPEGKRAEAPEGREIDEQMSLRGLFKKWFGGS
jgi:hypothetical protein